MSIQTKANLSHGFIGGMLLLASSAMASVAKSPLNFDFPYNSSEPVLFRPSLYPSFVNETKLKASLYRPSIDPVDYKEVNDPPYYRGRPSGDMKALAEAWASDEIDWYEIEEQDIFAKPSSHYAVTAPSGGEGYEHPVHVHFVHERSEAEDAIPILLLHGWPSSHLEWSNIIEPLLTPSSGDEEGHEQTFHVVAPDLPGFGFSPAPDYSSLGAYEIAEAMDYIMTKSLGYDEYGIVSTDAGWAVALAMVDRFPDNVIGHYSDFWLIQPTEDDLDRLAKNETTEEETAYITSFTTFMNGFYFMGIPNTEAPMTMGSALSDTPVGFAAYIWHLFDIVGDGYQYTHRELVKHTMALFAQGTYGGIRLYTPFFENFIPNLPGPNSVRTGAGVWGIANSPFLQYYPDVTFAPRSWTERVANVTYYSHHEGGGHFPAFEAPEEYVRELRTFFGGL